MCDVDFSVIITSFYHHESVLSDFITGCIIAIPLAVFCPKYITQVLI